MYYSRKEPPEQRVGSSMSAIEKTRQEPWLSLSLLALKALGESRYDNARSLWLKAYACANQLPADDPRRAAALNNVGFGDFIVGRAEQAATALGAAREAWRNVEAWVHKMELPSASSSSMFHFLLAAKHPETVAKLRKAKFLTLCAGAAAITKANLDRADARASADAQTHVSEIRAAFGEDAAEARAIAEDATQTPPPEQGVKVQSVEDRWLSIARNTAVEIRPLVDAVYLTAGWRPEYRDLNHLRLR